MAFDFKHLKAEEIYKFMEENATPAQKKAFKKEAFPVKAKKVSKKLYSADGEPIMYQLKDKDGNPKFNDKGEPIMRQKIEMVEVAGGDSKATFSLLKAKWWFAENFPGEVVNVPEKKEKEATLEGVHLRILQEPGAEPLKLTLVALKDRIVIKLDDGRNIVCSGAAETPILQEGTRPEMTLKHLEQTGEEAGFSATENVPARAGSGLRFSMMLSEAMALVKGKGLRSFGTWFFMAVLTVMTLLTVGDYLTVSAVDPHDFVIKIAEREQRKTDGRWLWSGSHELFYIRKDKG